MLTLTKKHHCCAAGSKGTGRQLRSAAEWFLPGAILLLIPKCPLCIVAYVAAFSGIGLSVSTGAGIRIALIAISSAALFYLFVRSLLAINRRA